MDGPRPSWCKQSYVIAGIAAAKAIADAHGYLANKSLWSDSFSPILECILNICWIFPDLESYKSNTTPPSRMMLCSETIWRLTPLAYSVRRCRRY
jgi:hypothetical protein